MEYFLSANGTGTIGDQLHPFGDIDAALAKMSPFDLCYIEQGEYKKLVRMTGKHDLKFIGVGGAPPVFDFKGLTTADNTHGVRVNGPNMRLEHIEIKNVEHGHGVSARGQVDGLYLKDLIIHDIDQSAAYAIYDWSVPGKRIKNITYDGLKTRATCISDGVASNTDENLNIQCCDNPAIINCDIDDVRSNKEGIIFARGARNAKVLRNKVRGVLAPAIYLDPYNEDLNGAEIAYNDLRENRYPFAISGEKKAKTIDAWLHHNLVDNNINSGCIFWDYGGQIINLRYEYNTHYLNANEQEAREIFISMPRAQLINCRFTKNLIVAPSGKPLFSFPEYAAGDTTNVIIDDNWYWGSTSGRLGTNYKYGDPQFVDPANGNFNLLADSPAQGYGAFQSMEDDSVSNFTLTVDGTIVSDPLAFKVYSDSSLTNELTALHLGDIRRNQNYTKDFWVKNMSADASGFVTPILSGDIVNKITSAFAPASQTIQPGASQKFTLTYSVKTGAADGGFSGTLSG